MWPFCLEAIQRNLRWRFQNLWPLEPPRSILNLHCLPFHIRDPLGRPILVFKSTPMAEASSSNKKVLVHALERLRLHLRQLHDDSRGDNPTLQYVVLLDLSELSFQSIVRGLFNKSYHLTVREPQDFTLFTWIARELAPRFPGMIGAGKLSNPCREL